MGRMSSLLCVVDASGVPSPVATASVASLLRSLRHAGVRAGRVRVIVTHADVETERALAAHSVLTVIGGVAPPAVLDAEDHDGDVVSLHARLAFSPGSINRVLRELRTDGRVVVRLVGQGFDPHRSLTAWRPYAIPGGALRPSEVAFVALDDERTLLEPLQRAGEAEGRWSGSGQLRRWVEATVVGIGDVTAFAESGSGLIHWERTTEREFSRLRTATAWGRRVGGQVRRRVRLRTQRQSNR